MNTDEPHVLLDDSLFAHKISAAFQKKVYLPDNTTDRHAAVRELHDTPAAGHPGIANTWELVRQHYEGP